MTEDHPRLRMLSSRYRTASVPLPFLDYSSALCSLASLPGFKAGFLVVQMLS